MFVVLPLKYTLHLHGLSQTTLQPGSFQAPCINRDNVELNKVAQLQVSQTKVIIEPGSLGEIRA